MIAALALTAVTLPTAMYGVHRFEQWSDSVERWRDARRDAAAPFVKHPGADDSFAQTLRSWLDAGQGSATAR